MSNRVNPPKQLKLPAKVAADPEMSKSFYDRDFILFQMWKRLGGGDDLVDEAINRLNNSVKLSDIFDIRKQIGSGKPVTIDTTGFAVDTTEQTTDKTEV